ncbi:LysR family transcriptional regulator [Bosea sp. (in: a-proteobacteria)]|uniref:LysR family transcriptional regulator n=1 Tax=Bosea sp. (in: a-proteobacteria) TaxID=1871050 RepID=UPI00260D4767|nr:LysR family transcriptional regulator [Bosea sp. (in: a-proteobacteria)]MCO5089557.1 LysR family transcriptional regulator [Bosea sp. (in: a-proteobacteria)]
MELRQLRYFIAVARLNSFSRAAESLNVAQSALSRQVQGLEEELATTLLLRDRRGLHLTEAGEALLERAEMALEQVRLCKEDVLRRSNVPKGDLRLGVLPSLGEFLMPRILARYCQQYPEVHVHLRSGFSGFVNDWLAEGHIDLGVMHSPWWGANLVTEPIVIGDLIVALPPEAAARRLGLPEKEVYEIQDLKDLPMVVPSKLHAQRILIERETAAHGISINVALEVDNSSIIKALVKEGMGCTVIAYSAVHSDVKKNDLRIARLAKPGIRNDISIVTRSDRPVTAAMRAMINDIKLEMRGLIQSGEWPAEHFQLVGSK